MIPKKGTQWLQTDQKLIWFGGILESIKHKKSLQMFYVS